MCFKFSTVRLVNHISVKKIPDFRLIYEGYIGPCRLACVIYEGYRLACLIYEGYIGPRRLACIIYEGQVQPS
jgi:hypothetical protein